MNSGSKGQAWVENLCHHFSTFCSEADDTISQDSVKFVGTQLITAGENLMHLCSLLVEDVLPEFSVESAGENGLVFAAQEQDVNSPALEMLSIGIDTDQDGKSCTINSASTQVMQLPRFDGAGFFRRWKVKKIMFVGDSLSLNQWSSLACMLHAEANTTFLRKGPITQVTFEDYHVIIFLYRTPYLVDIAQEQVGRVLKLDLIQQGNAWRGMDMLISNTWNRWTHTGNAQPWNFVKYGSTITKDMDRLVAFSKGLTTWNNWVEKNVDPSKIKVFFQGISPTHYMEREWGSKSSCD